ncbi:MAG: tyrosine-type recombinase/integrase [Actinomycetota bacterium]|jgi:site-specific recombinase XerD|nr:tyrosine-type recombinase/integrase [Actinomycetota bacterium]
MAEPTSRVLGVRVTGPLGPFADDYRVKLKERGYMPRSIIEELRHLARLSRWLNERRLGTADLTKERLEQFLSEMPRRRDGGSVCSRRALTQALEVLEEHGVVPLEAVEARSSPSEVLIASFERFLLQERAVARSTAAVYVARARRFLGWCAPSGEVVGLRASDVTDAVLRESTALSASATKLFVTALRVFLRFCFIEGLTPNDLSGAALSVARRRRSSLPKGIGPSVADALLRSCDRRRSKGRRDYAILLVLVRLGLRAGEVAGLRLEDIDWRAGEVVVRGKGRHEDRLPLPSDVGEAIAAYLQRGRPRTTGHREVFLRAVAPIGPLGTNGISGIVRAACLRAGVPVVRAHRLRHTVACQMADRGVPLPEIARALRHRSISSTAEYARVDVERLRTVAQPWPRGGGR